MEFSATVRVPEADEDWSDIAKYSWEAFVQSPLNQYYAETDLAFGWMACDAIDRAYKAGSAMLIQSAESMMRSALFNEADRRRVRIEITRKEPDKNPAVESNVTAFRERRQKSS